MFVRKGRSQTCDRIGKARLMQRNYIHIALAEQEVLLSRLPRKIQSVELRGFIEYEGLRRIKILRLPVSHNSASEADDTVIRIHNREHYPVPELVPDSFFGKCYKPRLT